MLPWIDLGHSEWRTLSLDRAEAKQAVLLRPDSAFVAAAEGVDNALVAWPTKLTLCPQLGDAIQAQLQERQVYPPITEPQLLALQSWATRPLPPLLGYPVPMSWMRPLGRYRAGGQRAGPGHGQTGPRPGAEVSRGFVIPDPRSAANLLAQAKELGINLIDTAPAYGDSEQRLGQLLAGQRRDWLLCTKVGEEFNAGASSFDFSPEHTRASVQRSLRRLNTDVLDLVLVHSNGDDLHIINTMGTLEALQAAEAGRLGAGLWHVQ